MKILLGATIGGFAGKSLERTIKQIRELGFEAVELYGYQDRYHRLHGALRPGTWFHELGQADFRKMRQWLKGFKKVSVHASTAAFGTPLFTINKRIQKEVIWQFKKLITAAGELEAGIVNSHCEPKDEYPLEMYWQEMLDVYRDLGNCARRNGVRFTIETLFPPTLKTYRKLITDINHSQVGSCLDFGHIVKCGEDVPSGLRGTKEGEKLANEIARRHIAALGNKVWHIHLHDVRQEPNGSWLDHIPLGEGFLDLKGIMNELALIKYNGAMIIELDEDKKMPVLANGRRLVEKLMAKTV